MPNTVIEAKNLTKTYGKKSAAFTALKNINLKIYEGESVAIVGKSGSGKSTLMHLLALLDRPTKGEIYVDGKNASNLKNNDLNKLRNERFGFVFQQFFMNANNTVLENVLLPLKIAKISRKERKKQAEAALKIVDLESKMKNKAVDLSGGQNNAFVLLVLSSIILRSSSPMSLPATSTPPLATRLPIYSLNLTKNKVSRLSSSPTMKI